MSNMRSASSRMRYFTLAKDTNSRFAKSINRLPQGIVERYEHTQTQRARGAYTPRRGDHNVTPAGKLLELVVDARATVHHQRPQAGLVAQLLRLEVDLNTQTTLSALYGGCISSALRYHTWMASSRVGATTTQSGSAEPCGERRAR